MNTLPIELSLPEVAVLRRALDLYVEEQRELRDRETSPVLSDAYHERMMQGIDLYYILDGIRKRLCLAPED